MKTVPRRLVCHVSRLDKNTTAEDLVGILNDAGVPEVICRKITNKDGVEFLTAAFYVSRDARFESIFDDRNLWSEGAELRDWLFYNKPL